MKEIIINCETGQETIRELTDEEIIKAQDFDSRVAEAQAQREAAIHKLKNLGLDLDDLKALGLG